jgi:hypothetical protein
MGPTRRDFLAGAAGLAFTLPVLAQRGDFNEREILPQLTSNDKEDIWTLHFRFQDPRIIIEKVPGRGTKTIWYMVYRVYNLDPKEETHIFVPDFELVTLDTHIRRTDEVLPTVEEVIRKREDPTGRFGVKNSVTISENPIPVSKKDAFPRAITGVAIWTDVDPTPTVAKQKVVRTNKFSIFIAGLSNGYTEEVKLGEDGKPTGVKIIKRKSLQLDFERLGDGEITEPSGIRWTGNATWMYRETSPIDELKKDAKETKVLGPQTEPIPAIPVKRIRE